MKLSIIIVNYNVKHFLEQCLNSVQKARQKVDGAEVIVIDNNSVDGSVWMLKEKFPDVNLIINQTNNGFAKACNQGINIATGEYILLLNPDCIVEEDTFFKTVHFLDQHHDGGGLGVKMIDGRGKFLPESKRSLPLPSVAVYKLTGLSKIFPHSQTFGRYHLGYLDRDKTHEVDVLAGAFMMIRRKALEKIGLLDEDFFMYGEDIDLSYRIMKAGYKNYYFPGTTIIHYKGESTRKTSVNYVLTFYRAMLIFTRKHFSGRQAAFFNILIHFAIYLRALAALLHRFAAALLLPLCDTGGIYAGMYLLTGYWEHNIKQTAEGYYPPEFFLYVLPSYTLIWMAGIWISGGYDKKKSLSKMMQGIMGGTVLILTVYALLPETMRYSRALILLGALWTVVFISLLRIMIHFFRSGTIRFMLDDKKRIAIAGNKDEASRVSAIIARSGVPVTFIGYVHPGNVQQPLTPDYIGSLEQLEEISRIFKIDEIIFCARDVSSREIISRMAQLNNPSLTYKIAPPESMFIIGSNSADSRGELYTVEINSILDRVNIRNKRILDLAVSFLFIPFIPVLFFISRNSLPVIKNIIPVLFGLKTWVGYSIESAGMDLPKIKPGVFCPADRLQKTTLKKEDVQRIDLMYAKDYRVINDIEAIWCGIRMKQ